MDTERNKSEPGWNDSPFTVTVVGNGSGGVMRSPSFHPRLYAAKRDTRGHCVSTHPWLGRRYRCPLKSITLADGTRIDRIDRKHAPWYRVRDREEGTVDLSTRRGFPVRSKDSLK